MNHLELTPKSEITSRIAKLQSELLKSEIDGALITHFIDLFYFTGTSQNGHLFVPAQGEPILMIKKSFARATKEASIDQIQEMKSMKELPRNIYDSGIVKTLGMELDVIPVNNYNIYKKLFSESEIIDISSIIRKIRSVKSPYEIELMAKAGESIGQAFSQVPEMYEEGMREIDLAARFESALRKGGYGGGARMRAFNQDFFYGNVNAGTSGAVPTYFNGPVGGPGLSPANNPAGAGWRKIEKDEVVFIDYATIVSGYVSDCTRIFATGKLSAHLMDGHKLTLEIQDTVLSMMKPGTNCREIYEKSLEIAEKNGLGDIFMGRGNDRVKFLGHGVGLELDEFPVFAKGFDLELLPGMTFALEPKFVFEDGAIGTENTFVMTESGPKRLTPEYEEITYLR